MLFSGFDWVYRQYAIACNILRLGDIFIFLLVNLLQKLRSIDGTFIYKYACVITQSFHWTPQWWYTLLTNYSHYYFKPIKYHIDGNVAVKSIKTWRWWQSICEAMSTFGKLRISYGQLSWWLLLFVFSNFFCMVMQQFMEWECSHKPANLNIMHPWLGVVKNICPFGSTWY